MSELLEKVQLRAAKIISGATNRTSKALIYQKLGWETLLDRRKSHRLATMYKVKHDLTPSYLVDSLPDTIEQTYNLRHKEDIPGVKARTSAFQNSFFPKSIREWNSLEHQIRNAPSIGSFKTQIKDVKHKPPDWFKSGKRKDAINHARLRMMCSSLNDHLYSQLHVIDNPKCPCGNPRESAKHYLLECPLYTIERDQMLLELRDLGFHPSLQNLLAGSNDYSVDVNLQAVTIIHNYLRSTGRFELS